ncbi:hypothetical protein ABFA25_12130 [Mycobacterium lepromatosis]
MSGLGRIGTKMCAAWSRTGMSAVVYDHNTDAVMAMASEGEERPGCPLLGICAENFAPHE